MSKEDRRTWRDAERGRRARIHRSIYTAPLLPEGVEEGVRRSNTMEKALLSFFHSLSHYALSPGKVLLLHSFLEAPRGRKRITFCPFLETLKLVQEKSAISFAQVEG